MKTSALKENNPHQVWQTYLRKVHQEDAMEPDIAASKKFWKNYETLIQQSQRLQKKTHSKPITLVPSKGIYEHIFLKYWNGVSCTITYNQEVPSTPPPKTGLLKLSMSSKDSNNLFGLLGFLGFTGLAASALGLGIGGFFALLLVFVNVYSIMRELLSGNNHRKQIAQNQPIVMAITQYTFHINSDHLIFTRIDQHKIKKTLCLDYYKVKSLKVHQGELRLKSLYHRSFNDRLTGMHIKDHFCIPVGMPQGKAITDFLREILLINKAQRS